MIRHLKRGARRAVHRVLTPHLDAQTDEITRLVTERLDSTQHPEPDRILRNFNARLHELRTIELRRLPVDGGVLLSAGCAGSWYFDWLEACAGPFERHIGVELYSPEPERLASNVTWIAESASSMPAVTDGSVDVVFSGQNLEHLWVDDLVGFLLEANRVLREGGWLVVDSPNRLAVEALGWVHPEHTIELSADEAVHLVSLAGFEPRVVRGLWSCRDPESGAWLPLWHDLGDVRELMERSIGRRPVDDDFVWWIESERIGPPAPPSELRAAVLHLFEQHWQARVNRGAHAAGGRSTDGRWSVPVGTEGLVYRTEPFPLFPGPYAVSGGDPALRVRLATVDGRELGTALGHLAGAITAAELGVIAELHLDTPLDRVLDGIEVTVDVAPLAGG